MLIACAANKKGIDCDAGPEPEKYAAMAYTRIAISVAQRQTTIKKGGPGATSKGGEIWRYFGGVGQRPASSRAPVAQALRAVSKKVCKSERRDA